ncbi:hypothetical protein [Actinomadura macra]|nr:hypothetical protein [Actinomadura macra]
MTEFVQFLHDRQGWQALAADAQAQAAQAETRVAYLLGVPTR